MMLCIVAKRCILQQKCLNRWIGSAQYGHDFTTFNPLHRPYPLKLTTSCTPSRNSWRRHCFLIISAFSALEVFVLSVCSTNSIWHWRNRHLVTKLKPLLRTSELLRFPHLEWPLSTWLFQRTLYNWQFLSATAGLLVIHCCLWAWECVFCCSCLY